MDINEDQRLKEITRWFIRFVRSFEDGDEDRRRNIVLKKDHTSRVCDEILGIGEEFGLTEDELRMAAAIALLHDVGRFEQYAKYGTFSDVRSEDHARLSVAILLRHDVLNGFDDSDRALILRAIEQHNRASLPRNESERTLFFSKLLRDADKLDIWRVVTDYYRIPNGAKNSAIELDLADSPGFSEAVYLDLMNQRIVAIEHIENLNDFKLLQIGWVFDVNFTPTFRRVKERRYLEMIGNALPRTNRIDAIIDVALRHLQRHAE